jgi:hypothetical protein
MLNKSDDMRAYKYNIKLNTRCMLQMYLWIWLNNSLNLWNEVHQYVKLLVTTEGGVKLQPFIPAPTKTML